MHDKNFATPNHIRIFFYIKPLNMQTHAETFVIFAIQAIVKMAEVDEDLHVFA